MVSNIDQYQTQLFNSLANYESKKSSDALGGVIVDYYQFRQWGSGRTETVANRTKQAVLARIVEKDKEQFLEGYELLKAYVHLQKQPDEIERLSLFVKDKLESSLKQLIVNKSKPLYEKHLVDTSKEIQREVKKPAPEYNLEKWKAELDQKLKDIDSVIAISQLRDNHFNLLEHLYNNKNHIKVKNFIDHIVKGIASFKPSDLSISFRGAIFEILKQEPGSPDADDNHWESTNALGNVKPLGKWYAQLEVTAGIIAVRILSELDDNLNNLFEESVKRLISGNDQHQMLASKMLALITAGISHRMQDNKYIERENIVRYLMNRLCENPNGIMANEIFDVHNDASEFLNWFRKNDPRFGPKLIEIIEFVKNEIYLPSDPGLFTGKQNDYVANIILHFLSEQKFTAEMLHKIYDQIYEYLVTLKRDFKRVEIALDLTKPVSELWKCVQMNLTTKGEITEKEIVNETARHLRLQFQSKGVLSKEMREVRRLHIDALNKFEE